MEGKKIIYGVAGAALVILVGYGGYYLFKNKKGGVSGTTPDVQVTWPAL